MQRKMIELSHLFSRLVCCSVYGRWCLFWSSSAE